MNLLDRAQLRIGIERERNLAAMLKQLDHGADTLDVQQIREKLNPYIIEMRTVGIELPAGSFVYRTRKCTETFNPTLNIFLQDLSYPPPQLAQPGRANEMGKPVFYCSYSKEPTFFELPGLQTGCHIILSIWQTTKNLWFNNVGYTDAVFKLLGANRECPVWTRTGNASRPDKFSFELGVHDNVSNSSDFASVAYPRDAVRELFGSWFMRSSGRTKDGLYKISAAIAELHLGNIADKDTEFSGILYPSASMAANADNLAIQPKFVDQSLKFKKAVHVKIENRYGNKFDITKKNESISTLKNGTIVWLGRLLKWEVPPRSQLSFLGVAGRDSYGDYEIGTDGKYSHWLVKDRDGRIVEIS